MILEEILTHKRKEIEELKLRFPLSRIQDALRRREPARPFLPAISGEREVHIIAELKKASPSRGVIRDDFNPLQIAELFDLAGADAISILTETTHFAGRPSYLRTVRRVTNLPLLRKDFVIDRYQIYESALLAADAVLLISAILTDEELKLFIEDAKKLSLEPLVEVHTENDLKKALDAGATLIGINNRNLQTLKVNLETSERLLRHVPKGITAVIESGISNHSDILRYKSLGVTAFLIGTVIMESDDIVKKLRELKGNPS
ncbi:MAG TPA: indole-3-glycerol phosphate synthase TrpC [Candidatus Omnitrophota bacterium]|nr:indole-3-glycerol phosphate synthase TrpC [Candidatus Omnitrophota bacterium]